MPIDLTFEQTLSQHLTIIGAATLRSSNIPSFQMGDRSPRVPIQFVIVTIISVMLFVFIAASAAATRIEDRSDNVAGTVNKQTWEQAALWACPLH